MLLFVLVLIYVVIACLSWRVIYARNAAEFPMTHRENPEGTAVFATVLAAIWPIGLPMTVMLCRAPRR